MSLSLSVTGAIKLRLVPNYWRIILRAIEMVTLVEWSGRQICHWWSCAASKCYLSRTSDPIPDDYDAIKLISIAGHGHYAWNLPNDRVCWSRAHDTPRLPLAWWCTAICCRKQVNLINMTWTCVCHHSDWLDKVCGVGIDWMAERFHLVLHK